MAEKRLRCGYTTGSCAAAASHAAVEMLLGGDDVEEVLLETPKGIRLRLAIEQICREPDFVSCAVRKDGGDDPDVTTGMLIFARAERKDSSGVEIDGGKGVGRVTKKGLEQPVGAAAINRVPREMITREVKSVCRGKNYNGGIRIEISAPEGEKIGQKTFNPRLGIQGGISILGTSGIVVPMSEEALIASIRVEMKMLLANGGRYLAVTPGNYGEAFFRERGEIDPAWSLKCSNYVGETLDMARELGVKGLLFIAHIGKFIKVSGGIMNTHSRNSDSRAELLAAQAARAGAGAETIRRILDTVTTEEGLDILEEAGLLKSAMEETVARAEFYLRKRAGDGLSVGLVLFSNAYGLLGESENAKELTEKIKEQEREDDR